MAIELPAWATAGVPVEGRIPVYYVDPDMAYPMIFRALKDGLKKRLQDDLAPVEAVKLANAIAGVPPHLDSTVDPGLIPELIANARKSIDNMRLDQYWYEACYQMIKLEMQRTLGRYDFEIRIVGDTGYKKRWRQTDLSKGRGLDAATGGLEAKKLYHAIIGDKPAARMPEPHLTRRERLGHTVNRLISKLTG